jgi:hypothetical protein
MQKFTPKITTIVILGTLIKLLAMLCIFSKWNGLEMFCGHWGLVYPPWFNCTTLINKCFGMQAINWSTKIFQSIPMVYHSLELLPNVRFWYLFTCKGFYFFEKLHCLQPWKQKNCIFCKYVKPISKKFVIFFFYVCVCLATCIISNVNIASNMLGTMVKYLASLVFCSKKLATHRKIKVKFWLQLILGRCTLWEGEGGVGGWGWTPILKDSTHCSTSSTYGKNVSNIFNKNKRERAKGQKACRKW